MVLEMKSNDAEPKSSKRMVGKGRIEVKTAEMPNIIDSVGSELKKAGWKDVGPGVIKGIDFDLVGLRRFRLYLHWNILVKVIPKLDQEIAKTWGGICRSMLEDTNREMAFRLFLLCLVTKDISKEALQSIWEDDPLFGLFDMKKLAGNGRGFGFNRINFLVVDIKNKQVYGKVNKALEDVKELLNSITNEQ